MAETIGWLTDKIIISELKLFHTMKQVERKDASEEHRALCLRRISVLQDQRNDLKAELSRLFEAVLDKKVNLKVYRQFKMYNDPRFRIKPKVT